MDELHGFKKCYVSARNGCGCLVAALSLPMLLFLVGGCFFTVTPWQQSQIEQGLTKEQVIRLLGTPRTRQQNDRVWVYDRGFSGFLIIDFRTDGTVDGYTL